jgi:transcriptional regulator with XRE-family HTH domain
MFGASLRAAREARGETLEDVAGRVPRLDPRYLGEIELGWHAPTIVTCKRIADALETRLMDLVQSI